MINKDNTNKMLKMIYVKSGGLLSHSEKDVLSDIVFE